ncbi:MAG: hypothetical protein NZR01_04400 [Bryobacteraceae bacterium]|nr:hypothetical protein [Bryobacteraceae bacterium]
MLLVKTARRDLRLAAPLPFGLDIHWLKEVAEGVVRGAAGIRLESAGRAILHAQLTGDWHTAVWREDIDGLPGLRVLVARRGARAAGASASLSWTASASPEGAAAITEIVRALLGIHPLHWVRDLLNSLGSRRAAEFVESAGASLRALDAIRGLWQSCGGQAEAALWELISDPALWSRFREWIASLLHEEGLPASLAGWMEDRLGRVGHAEAGIAAWALAALRAAGADRQDEEALAVLQDAARRIERALEVEGAEKILLALPSAAARELEPAALGRWARQQLEDLFGIGAQMAEAALRGAWRETASRIAAGAAEAARRQWELRLAAAFGTSQSAQAALDATFSFDPAGLAAARRAAAGDLDPVFAGQGLLRLRRAALTETFSQRFFVEVQLPFLRLRRKQKDLASVATAQASVTGDGRILVEYTAEAGDLLAADVRNQTAMVLSTAISVRDGEVVRDQFTLSFTDRRALAPSGFRASFHRILELYGLGHVPEPDSPCTATLALRLPGTLAEAWMRAPLPGTADYIPAMAKAARAVQTMARHWLPALYLDCLDAFSRPSAVHPLLAWAASPPSSGPRKKDLTYDFMDPKVLDAVLTMSAPAFRERLAEVRQMLLGAGRKQAASYYEPADTRYILANVRRQQRNFAALLAADAFLVESVLHVAECARELDRLARTSPRAAVSELGRFTREVAETFHRRLRRLYAGSDFLALGPLFFLEATSALADRWGDAARIGAVLTLEFEDGARQVFSNDAARRLF